MQTAPPAPPPTPGPPPERQARWLPLLALLGVMAFVTLGGFLFSGSPAGTAFAGDVEVGSAVEVAHGVTIQPAAGWQIAEPVVSPQGVVLEGGNGRLLVGVPGGIGSPEELVAYYASNFLEPQASQLSVGEVEPLSLPAGPAAVARYVGLFEGVATPIEGEVIGIVSPSGTAVVLDGWASQGNYGPVHDQVVAMAASVVIP